MATNSDAVCSRASSARGWFAMTTAEGSAAVRFPLLLVSPDGFLHIVPDLRTLANVSKCHGLRNEYMRNMVGVLTAALPTQRQEASNKLGPWQLLENVKWLQRVKSREIVVCVGGPKNFLKYFEQICSRAQRRQGTS